VSIVAPDATFVACQIRVSEFRPDATGTRLVFTEQGAYLDGHDTPEQREHGTRELLNALVPELRRQPATA
jgi:hypothetical protein